MRRKGRGIDPVVIKSIFGIVVGMQQRVNAVGEVTASLSLSLQA